MIRWIFIVIFLMHGFLSAVKSQESYFEYLSPYSYISVPVKISQNLVIIPVSINGSPPLDFILDSGIKTTILTEPIVAQFLKLDLSQRMYLFGLGGEGIIEVAKAENITLRIKEVKGENMDLVVLPEGVLSFSEIFGFPVYGIIGYDFLKNFPVSIDYTSQNIRVYKESSYRIRRRSRVIPIELANGKPYVRVNLSAKSSDTLTTMLLIDLGASHPVYLNKDNTNLVPKTLDGFLGIGISGTLMGEIGRLDKLMLGGLTIRSPIVAFPNQEFLTFGDQQLQWEGIIGAGILSRFHLTIDYPSGRIVLRPNRKFNSPFLFDPSGLEVIVDEEDLKKFIIFYVRPNSPAYEAGIESGDQIMAINGENYKSLDLQEVRDILSGKPSSLVFLTVLRDDDVIKARFRLRKDI